MHHATYYIGAGHFEAAHHSADAQHSEGVVLSIDLCGMCFSTTAAAALPGCHICGHHRLAHISWLPQMWQPSGAAAFKALCTS